MNSRILKIVSLFLTIVLLVNMLPLNVLADEISSDEISTTTSEPQIVEEVIKRRTQYTKEYRLDNGNFVAAVYNEPVHFEKDGQWVEIDNTLVSKSDGTYANTNGVWDVRFPQQLSRNNTISITKDGYTLSFGMAGELRNQGNLEIASTEESLSIASVPPETASLTVDDTEQIFSISSAQTATAQVEKIDASKAKEDAQFEEFVLEKNTSRLTYSDVYSNTDIRYDLQANRVKESIILESYDSNLRGYRYTLNVGELKPMQFSDGSIYFYDKDEKNVVMAMPAPFLLDNNLADNYDVKVSLTGSDGVYTLIYLLPQEWLSAEDRAWPVILDPVVVADLSDNNIQDTTVSSYRPNEANYMRGTLQIGYSYNSGISRAFLGFSDLPWLYSSDVIVGATMALNKVSNSNNSITAVVHKVYDTWDVETLCWNNMPDYDSTVEDYAIVQSSGRYYWDVTDIVRDWYENGNTGMLIKATDDVEYSEDDNSWKEFYSCNYGNYNTDPWLYITYRNNSGLESYWDYTASSAGRAGTGYVNDFTGNLVWVHNDIGFGGNKMPVSISHIYNVGDAYVDYFGVGDGWRTNYNQYVYPLDESYDYYCWEDADGTYQFFYYDSYDTYLDESGQDLVLKTDGSGTRAYSISDKYGNTSYFDEEGRLTFMENNQATTSSIAITYTDEYGPYIDKITDGAGRVYDFSYSRDLLTKITYYGNGSSPLSSVSFSYTGTTLTKITYADGKSSNFTYSDYILTSAQDVDGYKLQYSYHTRTEDFQSFRVKQVKEYFGNTVGGELNFEYAQNQTSITDHNGQTRIMQFNNFGNTLSVQDGEGRAQYAQYAINDPEETGKANQLRLSSRMQNTVNNYFTDHSFENNTLWTVVSGSRSITSSQKYLGNKSLALSNSAEVQGEAFYVHSGETVTFSAYLKTSGTTAVLKLTDGTTTVSGQTVSSSQWTRSEVSFTNYEDSSVYVTARVASSGTGSTYVDCVQFESMPTASRYNLVLNGDFYDSEGWSSSNGLTRLYNEPTAAPQLDNRVYEITGSEFSAKRVNQTVPVSGNANDTFVLSGWGKGDSVPLYEAEEWEDQRQFAVIGVFNYTDGSESDEFIAQFNSNTNSDVNWQFVSQVMVAEKAYSSVTVSIAYDYNMNTVYFDGIQLFKEEFGNSYTYDDEGNVESVKDLQKQITTYEYDSDNNLTKEILPTGAELTYTYDDYHNVKTATTEEGLTYSFGYDRWGNNTSVSITAGGTMITSTAVYENNGNTLKSTTNAVGDTTTYKYNANTGVLEWVQYPEDTTATRTNYTYDNMYRMATAAVTTDTGSALTAEYAYTNDNLTSIETGSTLYSFTYGPFALRSSVKAGNFTLASYTYTTDRNNYLDTLAYGNGDSVEYTYDDQGRVIMQTYEDESYVYYEYDNNGALATVTDSVSGISTTYYYDLTDRLMKYVETGDEFFHGISYAYDEINNLTALVETINDTVHTTLYDYDDDNRVTSVTNGSAYKEYSYDDHGRSVAQSTNHGTTEIKEDTFTFSPHSTVTTQTSAQIKTHEIDASGFDKTFTYEYDNNGNIISVSDGTTTTTYVYDSANQLIRENNQAGNFTHVWEYDDAGNILNRKEYTYTTAAQLGTPITTVSYAYDSSWGDLLIGYNNQSYSHDDIGNLTDDGTWEYTWQHGRQLASMTNGTTTWDFTYNADGLRTERTNGSTTYEYIYNGDKLSQMTVGSDVLYFAYDASGTPMAVTYNGTTYYYVTNVQGDVLAILNTSGTAVVEYTYDAWGNILTTTGSMANTLGAANPLRYRGYVYDQDTELYYLQSRYYNPEIGRFLNADDLDYLGVGGTLHDYDLFTYCGNNPIIRSDESGHKWVFNIVHVGTTVEEEAENKTEYTTTITYNKTKKVLLLFTGKTESNLTATFKYSISNDGAIAFDNTQASAALLTADSIRNKLAEEIYNTCIQKYPDSLSGRTVDGISSELLLHYRGSKVPILRGPSEVANIGGKTSDKMGFDSNAWLFEILDFMG